MRAYALSKDLTLFPPFSYFPLSHLFMMLLKSRDWLQVLVSTATKSVFEKSRPLKSNGKPVAFANA
jgi:hypothetical protein